MKSVASQEDEMHETHPYSAYCRFLRQYVLVSSVQGGEMSEDIMLNTNTTEKPVSRTGRQTCDRNHMRDVYRKKNSAYLCVKRGMDILLSAVALILLAPIFLMTAIAIKLEDRGPALFKQARAGKDGKPFIIYKFRSMCVDADTRMPMMMKDNEQTGHAFKIRNDPRITRVGKFIRKFSIDELPQLINIIKGDMSIVGPRPILTFQMDECSPYEQQRLVVQPGLTCYWQIGGRANIEWKDWVEMDLDYIEDMSLWTDLKIIVGTVPAVFDREGAY